MKLDPTKTCFVAMPIEHEPSPEYDGWKRVYEKIIKPAVKHADSTLQCYRADDNSTMDQWWPDVLQHLHDDFLCVADITGHNANVYYDRALRDIWSNRTVVITQDLGDIKADRQGNRAIRYSDKLEDIRDFEQKLAVAIADIRANPEKIRTPVQEYLARLDAEKRKEQGSTRLDKRNEVLQPPIETHLFQGRLVDILYHMGIDYYKPVREVREYRIYSKEIAAPKGHANADDLWKRLLVPPTRFYVVRNVYSPFSFDSSFFTSYCHALDLLRDENVLHVAGLITFLIPLNGLQSETDSVLKLLGQHCDRHLMPSASDETRAAAAKAIAFPNLRDIDFMIVDIEKLKSLETDFSLTA